MYKELVLETVGQFDDESIFEYFMSDDNKFNIKYHHRSKIVDTIQSKYNQFRILKNLILTIFRNQLIRNSSLTYDQLISIQILGKKMF